MMAASIGRTVIGALLAAIFWGTVIARAEAANQGMVVAEHDGIILMGMAAPLEATYDVSILDPGEALERIRKALALIQKKSPFAAARIESLKKSGPVFVIYEPRYPDARSNLASIQVAAFLPQFFHEDEEPGAEAVKRFPAVISRHGIKWPVAELATALVHELVGHGTQHLEDRRETMRTLDLECEAWLYEEVANQDLGLDKKSREMIRFRRQLEGIHCSDFKIYMRQNTPSLTRLWDVLNPDVPRLFEIFADYLDDQRRRGVVGDAQAFIAKQQEAERERISRAGSPADLTRVGLGYVEGIGQPPDHGAAAKWFARAAEQGFAPAQFNLGLLYEKGRGVARDEAEAARWYQRAAARGSPEAQYALGVLYETGHGVALDRTKAQALYDAAAARFDLRALIAIGYLYDKGRGFSRNDDKAAKLYHKAARLGHPVAQGNLGVMYSSGRGVRRDATEAVKWWRRAAASGYGPAQYNLGRSYDIGRGIERDAAKALVWYRKAAEQGNQSAIKILATLKRSPREIVK